jgi:hypothetical protein
VRGERGSKILERPRVNVKTKRITKMNNELMKLVLKELLN